MMQIMLTLLREDESQHGDEISGWSHLRIERQFLKRKKAHVKINTAIY